MVKTQLQREGADGGHARLSRLLIGPRCVCLRRSHCSNGKSPAHAGGLAPCVGELIEEAARNAPERVVSSSDARVAGSARCNSCCPCAAHDPSTWAPPWRHSILDVRAGGQRSPTKRRAPTAARALRGVGHEVDRLRSCAL